MRLLAILPLIRLAPLMPAVAEGPRDRKVVGRAHDLMARRPAPAVNTSSNGDAVRRICDGTETAERRRLEMRAARGRMVGERGEPLDRPGP